MNPKVKKVLKTKTVAIPVALILILVGVHIFFLLRPPLEWQLDKMPRAWGGQSDGFWAKVYGYRVVYNTEKGLEKATVRVNDDGIRQAKSSFYSSNRGECYSFRYGEGTKFGHLTGRIREEQRKVYDSWPEVRGASLDFTDWETRTRYSGGKVVESLLTHGGIPVELTLVTEEGVLKLEWRESGILTSREFSSNQEYPLKRFRAAPQRMTSAVYFDPQGKQISRVELGNGRLIYLPNESRPYRGHVEAEYRDGRLVSYSEYTQGEVSYSWSEDQGVTKNIGIGVNVNVNVKTGSDWWNPGKDEANKNGDQELVP